MTRRTNARLAGFMFLFYIANGVAQMLVLGRASAGSTVAERLASVARHPALAGVGIVLSVMMFADAVVLGVALWGLTRDVDHELSMLALCCRVAEGVLGALPVTTLGLVWLAAGADGAALDAPSVNALAALLLKVGAWKTLTGATCFAVGSTLFSWLFVRARTIPAWLAWLGVVGSAALVIGLPAQLAGFIGAPVTSLMWIPVAVFEVVLGFWLLIKGADAPATRAAVPGTA